MKKTYKIVQWFSGIFIFLMIVNWQTETAFELDKYNKKLDSTILAKKKQRDSLNNPKIYKDDKRD